MFPWKPSRTFGGGPAAYRWRKEPRRALRNAGRGFGTSVEERRDHRGGYNHARSVATVYLLPDFGTIERGRPMCAARRPVVPVASKQADADRVAPRRRALQVRLAEDIENLIRKALETPGRPGVRKIGP